MVGVSSEQHTDQQSDGRGADDVQDGEQDVLGSDHVAHSLEEHEQDGDQDGHKRSQRAGQLGVLVLFLGHVAVILGDVVVFFACGQGSKVAHQHDRDGDQCTKQDDHAQVRVQDAGHSQRARRGRHEHVGGVQAHCQRDGHGGHGDLGVLGQAAGDGAQQNECGITEDGDGDEVAGDGQAKSSVLFARDLEDGLGHGLGSAGFLQQGTGNGAQCDDQADISDGAAHAAGKGAEHVLHVHAGHDGKGGGGGDQCEERVDLQFNGEEDQHQNGQYQAEDHRYSRAHKQTSSYLTTLTRYSFQTSSGTRRPPVAQQIWVAFFITSAVRPCFAR